MSQKAPKASTIRASHGNSQPSSDTLPETVTSSTSNAMSSTATNSRNRQDTFLTTLMTLLMDDKYQTIMRFVPNMEGRFEICKPHEFVSTILPFHFHLKMWGAFENKLLRYGFHQVNKKSLTKSQLMGYTGSTTSLSRTSGAKRIHSEVYETDSSGSSGNKSDHEHTPNVYPNHRRIRKWIF